MAPSAKDRGKGCGRAVRTPKGILHPNSLPPGKTRGETSLLLIFAKPRDTNVAKNQEIACRYDLRSSKKICNIVAEWRGVLVTPAEGDLKRKVSDLTSRSRVS